MIILFFLFFFHAVLDLSVYMDRGLSDHGHQHLLSGVRLHKIAYQEWITKGVESVCRDIWLLRHVYLPGRDTILGH